MSKNPKIEGIVFRYGDDDYSFLDARHLER